MFKKHQLLDPISSISKISLLNFNPYGTKICIANNRVYLQTPGSTQFLERFCTRDSRDDICILGRVIDKYINFYLIPYQTKNNKIYKKLLKLTEFFVKGLRKLQETYYIANNKTHDNCTYTIEYFILLLTGIIQNEKTSYSPITFENTGSPENLLDVEKLGEIWSEDDITHIHKLFNKCFTDDSKPLEKSDVLDKNILIINTLLNTIDEKFFAMVQSTNSG